MDADQRTLILERATRAPTSDNSQPFHYRWETGRLHIHHIEDRARRRGNAGNSASLIGLGCLLESLEIAASAEGLRPDLKLRLEQADDPDLWVVAEFRAVDAPPDPLLDGLSQRCSDRRLYEGGDLSEPVFDEISGDMRRFEGPRLYFQSDPPEDLIAYILDCDEFLWNDSRALKDTLNWVRWSEAEARSTRDGILWRGLAIPYVMSRVLMLAHSSDRFRRFLRSTGAPLQSQRRVGVEQIRSSAALGCLTLPRIDPSGLVVLGRAFLRTWVRLNMAGYGLQVMANPSLHIYQHTAGLLPDDYPDESLRVFARGRSVLVRSFGAGEDEIPSWAFRTGRSSALPPAWWTYRRRLADIVRES